MSFYFGDRRFLEVKIGREKGEEKKGGVEEEKERKERKKEVERVGGDW